MIADPHPDHPGWLDWKVGEEDEYNRGVLGEALVRKESDDHCRVRIVPGRLLSNTHGNVHGGATLGLIDISLFAAATILRDIDVDRAVTLAVDTQFIGAGDTSKPLDAVVEVLRTTGRLCFLRGLVEQEGVLIASFSGTIRKPSPG